jgi:hypothetical protein
MDFDNSVTNIAFEARLQHIIFPGNPGQVEQIHDQEGCTIE